MSRFIIIEHISISIKQETFSIYKIDDQNQQKNHSLKRSIDTQQTNRSQSKEINNSSTDRDKFQELLIEKMIRHIIFNSALILGFTSLVLAIIYINIYIYCAD